MLNKIPPLGSTDRSWYALNSEGIPIISQVVSTTTKVQETTTSYDKAEREESSPKQTIHSRLKKAVVSPNKQEQTQKVTQNEEINIFKPQKDKPQKNTSMVWS